MTSRPRTALKLAYFAGLSLLIHVVILLGIGLPAPWNLTEPPPLEARLQPSAPPSIQPAAVPRKPRRVANSTKRVAPPPASGSQPVASAPASIAEAGAVGAFAPIPQPQAGETAPPDTVPPPPQPTADTQEQPPPASAAQLPQKGEIDYVLYYGAQRMRVGRTRQTWEIKDGRYRLSSLSETTGIVALFASQRIAYESRGRITESGLQPESFTTQRTRRGKTESAGADFDWQAMQVSIGNPRQTAALPASTQDLVSFMYQVGLMDLAQGRMTMPVTNGWKLERYELEIGPEQRVQTPLGALLALPITQVRRPGQESVELWLAPAYRLLPVRIRFFDREGAPTGEQLVDDIRVSSE